MNCLKSLRKNFQWLQERLHVYLHRFMRKLMETLTLHTRMRFILPPTEGIKNSNGKGVQEKAISKGVGSDSQGLFFQGLWNKNYCFYWWFYINSYSWMLFSQLTCMILQSTCILWLSSAHELCGSSSSLLYISQYNCGIIHCYGHVLILAFF